jgi:uroporphyrinogen III methyltransferase/synthase
MTKKRGKVFLVGAGPGDPELITLKGIKALQKADAVVYDLLANPELLKRAPQAQHFYVGKQGGKPSMSQDAINRLLLRLARLGKQVVRLKGGDPFVFGRGGEEAEFLSKHRIAFELVPGITAGIAAPAYAGIPVTHRDLASEVTLVTAHEDPQKESSVVNWEALAQGRGTLVTYMGVKTLPRVTRALLKGGKPANTPVALIYRGTLPNQKVLEGRLDTIARLAKKARFQAPALTVIGRVVNLRKKLKWFERKPLFGKKILVTRSRKQASVLREKLEELGAHVLECPVIRIETVSKTQALDRAIRSIQNFDWLVFTSANGVEGFFERFLKLKRDLRRLGKIKIACIGPATREALERLNLFPDFMPKEFVAESLFESLREKNILKGKRFLLARSPEARNFLSQALKREGAAVTEVAPYEAKPERGSAKLIGAALRAGDVSAVTFTSSQIAQNFVRMAGSNGLRRRLKKTKIFSIGPITTRTIKSLGLSCSGEAKVYTIPGLVDAVVKGLKD